MPENQSRLNAIRVRFLDRLSGQRSTLERLAGIEGANDEILDIAHKIAGIAGSLGFPALSAAASEVEMLLVNERPQTLRGAQQLEQLMHQIDAAREN
ncbi:Hpt domain-containing protein [Novosphingobium beihaiensis]|uniref:Hpt domain-containing protein n=1 Tax=Novosphingobium beihaiensis TaxID=2930389 RepID=A0ABT0BSV7_9SPHN|nr:Hpt domain-containing protein [Novosphingobium beihaiensis]MCJ2188124.1 Hpt domain-containing protein [Novosphingobium beihaiensis]